MLKIVYFVFHKSNNGGNIHMNTTYKLLFHLETKVITKNVQIFPLDTCMHTSTCWCMHTHVQG